MKNNIFFPAKSAIPTYVPSFDKEKSSGKYSSLSRNNIIEVVSSFNWLETSPMALGTSTFGLHMIVLLSLPK